MNFANKIIQTPNGSKKEVIESRTQHSKTFDMGGGKFKLIKGLIPIHYEEDGEFKEIDFAHKVIDGVTTIDTIPYILKIHKGTKITYESKINGMVGEVSLRKIGGSLYNGIEDFDIEEFGRGVKITWQHPNPDFDIYLLVTPSGVEFFKELKNANAPTTFEWDVDGDIVDLDKKVEGSDSQGNRIKTSQSTQNNGNGKRIFSESFDNQVSKVVDKRTRVKEWTDEVNYPVTVDVPDITENITDDEDDGYGYSYKYATPYTKGWDNHRGGSGNASVPLGLTVAVAAPTTYARYFFGGFRFQTLGIPNAATIDLAVLKLFLRITGGSKTKVYGDDVDDAPVFTTGANKAKDITKTTANVAFSPTATGNNDITITTILQELVDRGGWSSGNDIRLVFFDQQGAATSGNFAAAADDYFRTGGTPAVLEVDFTAGAGDLSISVNDSIAITESIVVENAQLGGIDVSDNIAITESVNIGNVLNIDVTDTVTVSEDVVITNTELGGIDVSDNISISENITIELSVSVNVNDSVTISEDTTAENSQLGGVDISDSITVSESVTVNIVIPDANIQLDGSEGPPGFGMTEGIVIF